MPFRRQQVYGGNGVWKSKRKTTPPAYELLPSTSDDRERQVLDIYRDAVKAVLADPNVQFTRLVRLLEQPGLGPTEIIDNFPWEVFETKFREAQDVLAEQLASGAQQEAAKLFYDFKGRDPEVLIWGNRHAAEMVTSISEEQRNELRTLVMSSHLNGIAPKTLARDIRSVIGLHPRYQSAVVRYHRGLLRKGVSPEFAGKQTQKYHDRLLTSRAKMIARTEVMKAENYGKLVGWKRLIEQGMLSPGGQKIWHTAIDNVCPVCLPMDGKGVGLNDAFMITQGNRSFGVITPPAHPHCRCTITYRPPTVEELTGGITAEELISQITDGTYTPEPESTPEPPVPTAVPRAETAARAEAWANARLGGDTGRTVTVHRYDPDAGPPLYRRSTEEPITRSFDYTGIDVDVANTLNRILADFARDHPEAWKYVIAVGTSDSLYANTTQRMGDTVYAEVTRYLSSGDQTFALNPKWLSKKNLPRFIEGWLKDVETGFHPPMKPGVSAVEAILIHELTHVRHNLLKIEKPGWPDSLLDHLVRFTGKTREWWNTRSVEQAIYITNQVSAYAAQDVDEFIAEAYLGALTSPNPTPAMLAVQAWLDSA